MNKATCALTLILLALISVSTHVADDAAAPAPPPPAPAKATGELTDVERLFQGAWRLGQYKDDSHLGAMHIDGRDFTADGVHGNYKGYVTIRADTSPAQIDFTIEKCGCNHEGKTSTGLYRKEDGELVFVGPVPGDPRPKGFDKPNDMWRMRPLDDAAESDGKKSP